MFPRMVLLFVCYVIMTSSIHCHANSDTRTVDEGGNPIITTKYGQVKGKVLNVSKELDLEIFLGVPYAKPPVGDLRLARPQVPEPWQGVRDATKHGAQCVQRIIPTEQVLEGVPYSEDCLFVDIYTPRYKPYCQQNVSTMMFIHGGRFYGGSGAKYNFTNVALRGVAVVSVSYRLDILGFLSTADDVIPGNFGLMDMVLALDWIRENIAAFGGNPNDITLFGGSSGGASVSLLMISPLTRGKFQKAIMISGVAPCLWAIHNNKTTYANRHEVARKLAEKINCSLPSGQYSRELLTCIRNTNVTLLAEKSVELQQQTYGNNMIFTPVVETTFGFIPDTPINLLQKTNELVHIPTIFGYTKHDGSTFVRDPENDGVRLEEFKAAIQNFGHIFIDPEETSRVYKAAIETYLPKNLSRLSPFGIRDRLITATTDALFVSCTMDKAILFHKAGKGAKSYMIEFAYRASYAVEPAWLGVAHATERGFVLGLPSGPDAFSYPTKNTDDQNVADFIVTTWTNFAKSGNPTPQPVQNVLWLEFDPTRQNVMVIEPELYIKKFSRSAAVKVWGQTNDGNAAPRFGIIPSLLALYLGVLLVQ